MNRLINVREICMMTIAIDFLPFLRIEEKWFVSKFLGSKESDLYFSPWKFVAIIWFPLMISQRGVYTKYLLDDLLFVRSGRFHLFIAHDLVSETFLW